MSSMPECVRCGVSVHYGQILCEDCAKALQDLLAAKDEALRKIRKGAEVLSITAGGELGYDIHGLEHDAIDALSLTPADALRRWEAMKRVVEAARALASKCREASSWTSLFNPTLAVEEALAALEEAKGDE